MGEFCIAIHMCHVVSAYLGMNGQVWSPGELVHRWSLKGRENSYFWLFYQKTRYDNFT